jgi:hypothetical protein
MILIDGTFHMCDRRGGGLFGNEVEGMNKHNGAIVMAYGMRMATGTLMAEQQVR